MSSEGPSGQVSEETVRALAVMSGLRLSVAGKLLDVEKVERSAADWSSRRRLVMWAALSGAAILWMALRFAAYSLDE